MTILVIDLPKKDLINIQHFDVNKCFKWCLIRYLNPTDHHPARIRKVDKMFESELDFKNILFPIKMRDTDKIEKRIALVLAFLFTKIKDLL